jgi:hypothetical protein
VIYQALLHRRLLEEHRVCFMAGAPLHFQKSTEMQYSMWSESLLDNSGCDALVIMINLGFRGLVRPANGLPEP